MKTKKVFVYGLLAVIFALAFTACDDDSGDNSGGNGGGGNGGGDTSPPTMRWTAVASSTFSDQEIIRAITYGDDKFVAVGDSGKMAYSADGKTWIAVATSGFGTSYTQSTINSVVYGGGKFVAVGGYGKMAYSDDGITWSPVAAGAGGSTFASDVTGSIYDIAYGDNTFVAVGVRSYNGSTTNPCHAAYSSDGINWTGVSALDYTITAGYISSIAFGNGKFVIGTGSGGQKAYSDNNGMGWIGVTDSKFASTGTGSWINAITYGNKFVAGGGRGTITNSDDGITWTTATNNKVAQLNNPPDIEDIAYGNGKFVAVGNLGTIAYSSDGNTWDIAENSTFSTSPNRIYAVAYGNNTFVAVGMRGHMAWSTGNIE